MGIIDFGPKFDMSLGIIIGGFVTLITRFILSQNDYYLNEMFASVTLQLLEESRRTTGVIILNWREHFGSDTEKLLKLLTLLSTPMRT